MPRRVRSSEPAGWAGIPGEILHNILVRLPAKSVLCCRAVCWEWRRLTFDPAFLVEHHRNQPTLHLVRSFRTNGDHLTPDRLDAIDLHRAERRVEFLPSSYWFDASCDGLFINGGSICNPAMRQQVWLSRMESRLVGLYRHQPSGEYRVLCLLPSYLPSEVYCPISFCVFAVGSSQLRRVSCSITRLDRALGSWRAPDICNAPVLLNGNLHMHWQKQFGMPRHRIMVFDTVAESVWQMQPPPVMSHHIMQLFDMSGMLALSCSSHPMTKLMIFGLQDYESKVWSLQYRIDLPVMEIRRFQEHGYWAANVVSAEGDVLVSCPGWLLHYDRNGNLVAKFQYDGELPVVTPYTLKESLIEHDIFRKAQKN